MTTSLDFHPAREPGLLNRSFVLLLGGSLTFYTSFQLLLTALPLYARSLGARDSEIGLIIGLFAASAMVVRLPIGLVLDTRGRVPVLVLGAAIFALSSAGYALAATVGILLAIRLFHGLGMASFNTAGQTLAVDVSPARRRGTALSLNSAAANVASGLGPAAGVAVAVALGYPPLFAISVGFALVALALCVLIREPSRTKSSLVARRSLRGVFQRSVIWPGLILLCLQLTYGAVVSFTPLLAVERGLQNPGLFFTAFALASVSSQSIAGQVSDRFGRKAAIVPGLLVVGLGLVAISVLGGWSLLIAGVIYGAGFGATQPSLFALGGDLAGPAERGAAMATLGLFLELGISAGSIVAGLFAEPFGLSATFVAFAGVALVGLLLAVAMRLAPRHH